MGNYKIIFEDCSNFETQLECFYNSNELLSIIIGESDDNLMTKRCITLDKRTAVKLVKVMKTEISKMEGGHNG